MRGSKNRTSMPSFEKVCVNRVHVPPYRLLAEMKFWPECTIVSSDAVIAAWPLANASAAAPPSSAARRFSSTSVVGFISRRVDVAELAQAEQIRRVLGIVKHVARRGVDRHGASRGRGVGHLTGVQCQGAQATHHIHFLTHVLVSPVGQIRTTTPSCTITNSEPKRNPRNDSQINS